MEKKHITFHRGEPVFDIDPDWEIAKHINDKGKFNPEHYSLGDGRLAVGKDKAREAKREVLQRTAVMNGETTPGMLARLLHEKGGTILVVTNDLEEPYTNHPQINVWADNKQEWMRKEVPPNTRAIMWSRWVSHSKVDRLNKAVKQLHILKFPFLRTAEIKLALSEIVASQKVDVSVEDTVSTELPQAESVMQEDEILKSESDYESHEEHFELHKQLTEQVEEQTMVKLRKPERGEMNELLPNLLNDNALATDEAKRLMPIVRAKHGIEMTFGAMYQAVLAVQRKLGVAPVKAVGSRSGKVSTTSRKVKTEPAALLMKQDLKPAVKVTVKQDKEQQDEDSFAEAERMLKEAQAVISLLQEFIPRLRKETAVLRKRQDKIRAMFLGDDE